MNLTLIGIEVVSINVLDRSNSTSINNASIVIFENEIKYRLLIIDIELF